MITKIVLLVMNASILNGAIPRDVIKKSYNIVCAERETVIDLRNCDYLIPRIVEALPTNQFFMMCHNDSGIKVYGERGCFTETDMHCNIHTTNEGTHDYFSYERDYHSDVADIALGISDEKKDLTMMCLIQGILNV